MAAGIPLVVAIGLIYFGVYSSYLIHTDDYVKDKKFISELKSKGVEVAADSKSSFKSNLKVLDIKTDSVVNTGWVVVKRVGETYVYIDKTDGAVYEKVVGPSGGHYYIKIAEGVQ